MPKNLPDSIKTLTSLVEFKLKEKGSLFHSISIPILNINDAEDFLNKIRKQYYDATHHCYSYKLHDGTFKYSDDGEPSGTAGLRIYNAQNHTELTDLITVVIRYFGGTKLGVGPLGKAYYDAALTSLSQNTWVIKTLYQQLVITYDFSMSKTVHHLISKNGIIIKENLFEETPKIIAQIKPSHIEKFILDVSSLDQQKIKYQIMDEFLFE